MSPAEHAQAVEKFSASGGKVSVAAICLLGEGRLAETAEAAERAGLSLTR
jgi:hypothetical protein